MYLSLFHPLNLLRNLWILCQKRDNQLFNQINKFKSVKTIKKNFLWALIYPAELIHFHSTRQFMMSNTKFLKQSSKLSSVDTDLGTDLTHLSNATWVLLSFKDFEAICTILTSPSTAHYLQNRQHPKPVLKK